MTVAGWNDRTRDRLLALIAAGFALALVVAARGIEDSMLSDAVGAGGVPQGVGLAMLAAALGLFVKSFVGGRGTPATATAIPTAAPAATATGPSTVTAAPFTVDRAAVEAPATADRLGPLARTAALVGLLLGYGALLPLLGYPLTVSLLVGAVGWLGGAALRWPLLLSAALAGPVLWAMFDLALQVRMPIGRLWG